MSPAALAVEMILSMTASLSGAVFGIPSSVNGRQRMAAPYFLASGINFSSRSTSALTELIRARPGYARRPASRAVASLVSIARGASVSWAISVTARFMAAAWSMPPTPIFTSSNFAPAFTWSSASRLTEAKEPSLISAASFFRPVGLMRSPISTVGSSLSTVTVLLRLVSIRRRRRGANLGGSTPCRADLMAAICSGVVPQQPPT